SGGASGWLRAGEGSQTAVESVGARSGRNCLRVSGPSDSLSPHAVSGGGIGRPLDVALLRGRHLTFSAFIRTSGVVHGEASLVIRVSSSERVLAMDGMEGQGATGSSDWKRYIVAVDVDSLAQRVTIGAGLT